MSRDEECLAVAAEKIGGNKQRHLRKLLEQLYLDVDILLRG